MPRFLGLPLFPVTGSVNIQMLYVSRLCVYSTTLRIGCISLRTGSVIVDDLFISWEDWFPGVVKG